MTSTKIQNDEHSNIRTFEHLNLEHNSPCSIVLLFCCSVVLIFLISSCKKDSEITTSDFGYDYFPTQVGQYVIYEVDSIWQDDISAVYDTTRYQLKELIASTFLDNSDRPTLRIERYKKFYNPSLPYDSMQWTLTDVWLANRTSATAEKVEENIRYLKIVFPVKEGKQWDGNVFNMLGIKEYEIISLDVQENINNINFDSVLTVKQFEEFNYVKNRYESEKYAKRIGLAYKRLDSLIFQPKNGSDIYPYDDTIGYTFTQKIISYGKQ